MSLLGATGTSICNSPNEYDFASEFESEPIWLRQHDALRPRALRRKKIYRHCLNPPNVRMR